MRFRKTILIFLLPAAGLFAQPGIVPIPMEMTFGEGAFNLNASTRIYYEAAIPELPSYAERFATRLRQATGFQLPAAPLPVDTTQTGALYFLAQGARSEWGPEGYSLTVTPQACRIRANAAAGFFYATQSLLQLLPAEIAAAAPPVRAAWPIPSVSLLDRPRFAWRGMHLDVCRHFFPVTEIKKYIDLLAMYKLNIFHWHLSDDQGWRIEIKKYPRLTETGAWRNDGTGRYGGFYTQEEIRAVVAYAAERAVTIVPEIEMPGHAMAALASYPWLGCTGGPYRVQFSWGIFDDVFCAGRDTTFAFLEDVLTEVMALFPGTYIHVGGDECPKTRWKSCPRCQARIQAEGLQNETELQGWFTRRIERFLSAHGRRLIGWDEILDGGIAAGATAQAWRGLEYGIAGVRSGHDVVMSPTSHCYFDYYQGNSNSEPKAIGGYIPLEKVYELEPVPPVLTPEEAAHVLGAQANLWTEWIADAPYLEYMLLPRLCALSEVVWSSSARREYGDFTRRMADQYPRLEAAGVNVRVPPAAYFAGTGEPATFEFQVSASISGAQNGAGARVGSDALRWSMTEEGRTSGATIVFNTPRDMRMRIPYYSLTFSYKTNLALDTLFIGFRDADGRGFSFPLLQRHMNTSGKWVALSLGLSSFKAEAGFDSSRVAQFGFWTHASRAGADFFFADIYLGLPDTWPAAHAPIVFFDGSNFNPLFRVKGFGNAPGSGVLQGGGLRSRTNALRWLPPADYSSSAIRWRFNETVDFRQVLLGDTLKLALKAPAGCDSLQLAFTDAGTRLSRCWLTAAEGCFDGQWHNLRLPLTRFAPDSGFAAGAVDLFSFFIRSRLPGAEILLTDIWIGQPSAGQISGIERRETLISGYRLEQNYPNPFNPLTTIAYRLAQRGRVRLEIYNLLGERVATLVDAAQEGGAYQLYWDARCFASGSYYYRLQVNDFVHTRKMVLVK